MLSHEIEPLVMPDCPHAEHATRALETTLTELGVGELQFRIVVVSTDEQAQAFGFPGSPTFRVDGRDVFDGNRTPALFLPPVPVRAGAQPDDLTRTRCAGNSPRPRRRKRRVAPQEVNDHHWFSHAFCRR